MDAVEVRRAARELRGIWVAGNEYLQGAAPWATFKADPGRAAMQIRTGLNLIRLYAVLSAPFVPDASAAMLAAVGAEDAAWPEGARSALEALPRVIRSTCPACSSRRSTTPRARAGRRASAARGLSGGPLPPRARPVRGRRAGPGQSPPQAADLAGSRRARARRPPRARPHPARALGGLRRPPGSSADRASIRGMPRAGPVRPPPPRRRPWRPRPRDARMRADRGGEGRECRIRGPRASQGARCSPPSSGAGIGRAVVLRLLAGGARVMATDLDGAALGSLAEEAGTDRLLTARGGRHRRGGRGARGGRPARRECALQRRGLGPRGHAHDHRPRGVGPPRS